MAGICKIYGHPIIKGNVNESQTICLLSKKTTDKIDAFLLAVDIWRKYNRRYSIEMTYTGRRYAIQDWDKSIVAQKINPSDGMWFDPCAQISISNVSKKDRQKYVVHPLGVSPFTIENGWY